MTAISCGPNRQTNCQVLERKNMKVLLSLLILITSLYAQTAYTVLHSTNHGGFGLSTNVGANAGDKIVMDVKCDHNVDGQCFDGIPVLQRCAGNFPLIDDSFYLSSREQIVPYNPEFIGMCDQSTPFELITGKSGFQHQVWRVVTPTTGDQFVLAQYFWVGTGVLYKILIVAAEKY
jgi:hypothetical protein